MPFNNYLNDFLTLTSNNTDYVWFKFSKPCGYSFIFPFLKDSPSSILYTHIDSYWKNTNNIIMNQKGEILYRTYNKSIRQWICDSNMVSETSIGEPLLYTIYFNVLNYENNINN
jgi:hypothetical protein